jgi:hypothetical protein
VQHRIDDMSEVKLYEGTAPATPPAGVVTIYAKIDGKLYWKADDGTETPFYNPVLPDFVRTDGAVPLTGNWDAGAFLITAERFQSDVATGTPPFAVASTTRVPNLNADKLDDFDAIDFATAAQGVLADTATQPGDNISTLTNDSLYLAQSAIDTLAELNAIVTDATLGDAADFATAAQGALADTAVQPGSLAAVATSGDSDDLIEGATNLLLTSAERSKIATIPDAQNNVQTGTTYTIQASDNGKNIVFTNAAAIAVTLPDTLALDFQCSIVQANTGVPTVTPNTDTINGAAAGVAPSGQWAAMYLTQFLDTEWMAIL